MATEPTVTLELARSHGITDSEYTLACDALGRTPTWPELGVLSVMWSEHCSYKSSRVHLKRLPTKGPRSAPDDTAGWWLEGVILGVHSPCNS